MVRAEGLACSSQATSSTNPWPPPSCWHFELSQCIIFTGILIVYPHSLSPIRQYANSYNSLGCLQQLFHYFYCHHHTLTLQMYCVLWWQQLSADRQFCFVHLQFILQGGNCHSYTLFRSLIESNATMNAMCVCFQFGNNDYTSVERISLITASCVVRGGWVSST